MVNVQAGGGRGGENSTPRIGLWQALFGVASGRPHTFRRIAAAPRSGLVAFVLVTVSVGAGALVASRLDLSSRVEVAMEKRLGRPATEAELELAARASRVSLYVAVGVKPWASLALLGFAAWALRQSWGTRARPSFSVVFSLCVYSFTPPALLEGLLRAIVAAHRGVVSAGETGNLLRANLRAFLDEDVDAVLGAVAQSLDVFDLWWAILLTWGLVEGAGLSRTGAVARVGGVMAGLALGRTAIVLLAG